MSNPVADGMTWVCGVVVRCQMLIAAATNSIDRPTYCQAVVDRSIDRSGRVVVAGGCALTGWLTQL